MNLARVLEEGIGNFILNKLFKNEYELDSRLCEMLELGLIDLELEVEAHHIREYSMGFELNDKKYRLSVCCNVLIDESLVPYACLVFENNTEEVPF